MVLELLIQTHIFTVLIYNLKPAWPTKTSMPFLSSLNNLLYDAYVIFQGVDYFGIGPRAQNMLTFGRRCSTPLNVFQCPILNRQQSLKRLFNASSSVDSILLRVGNWVFSKQAIGILLP